MYIATYGTLRYGGRLHSAISTCKCTGLFRLQGNYVMVATPSFFPAIVDVSSHYLRSLLADHPDDNEDSWGSTGDSCNSPLVEVYLVETNSVLSRLDIIEGVPHLYRRQGMTASAVGDDTITKLRTRSAYSKALNIFGKACKDLKITPIEELSTYVEGYVMSPNTDWLQGCDIIWNGNFNNKVMHPTRKFDYHAWAAARREELNNPTDRVTEQAVEDAEVEVQPAARRWETPPSQWTAPAPPSERDFQMNRARMEQTRRTLRSLRETR